MAATFTAIATNVAWSASAKSMLALFNGVGSGVVPKVRRIWLINAQTAVITGVSPTVEIRRTTAQSAGTTITPVKRDTNSSNLPAQVLCATGGTVTTSDLFRRFLFNTTHPTAGGAITQNLLYTSPTLGLIFDAGSRDSGAEAIVLREGTGISIGTPGIASPAGVHDFEIEFHL